MNIKQLKSRLETLDEDLELIDDIEIVPVYEYEKTKKEGHLGHNTPILCLGTQKDIDRVKSYSDLEVRVRHDGKPVFYLVERID